MKKEPVEVRKNDDGSIDEIVARGCDLHIEQMSTHGWYIGVDGADGSYWQFWLGAKNTRSAVVVRHSETVTADENKRHREQMAKHLRSRR